MDSTGCGGSTGAVPWLVVHHAKSGPVAQLGARLDGIQEVTGSIPVRSTNLHSASPELRLGKISEGCRAVAA